MATHSSILCVNFLANLDVFSFSHKRSISLWNLSDQYYMVLLLENLVANWFLFFCVFCSLYRFCHFLFIFGILTLLYESIGGFFLFRLKFYGSCNRRFFMFVFNLGEIPSVFLEIIPSLHFYSSLSGKKEKNRDFYSSDIRISISCLQCGKWQCQYSKQCILEKDQGCGETGRVYCLYLQWRYLHIYFKYLFGCISF